MGAPPWQSLTPRCRRPPHGALMIKWQLHICKHSSFLRTVANNVLKLINSTSLFLPIYGFVPDIEVANFPSSKIVAILKSVKWTWPWKKVNRVSLNWSGCPSNVLWFRQTNISITKIIGLCFPKISEKYFFCTSCFPDWIASLIVKPLMCASALRALYRWPIQV